MAIISKLLALLAVFITLLGPSAAMARTVDPSGNTTTGPSGSTTITSSAACQNTKTAPALKTCVTQSPLVQDIQKIINFLSAGVGIVVIGVIILGGIQYSMAGDNSQATGAAKQRIMNGLIALVAFIFMFAFLNWLLPGGAFG